MPSSKVERAKEKRDIQVHTGALVLSDYKWSLKSWDGELLATQYFKISSQGDGAIYRGHCMGRYTLVTHTVMHDGTPVYKHDERDTYLYRYNGNWIVHYVR